jgi:hypothetical protein
MGLLMPPLEPGTHQIGVARGHIFEPKIPIWVNFGGSFNGRYWCIVCLFGLFTAVWFIFGHFGIFYGYIFGIFFTILVFCTKKNLAALHQIARAYKSSGRSGR